MTEKPRGRRPGGKGRAARAAPSRQKPPVRRPEGAGRAARAAPSHQNPPGRQSEGAGRAARAPSRLDAEEERNDKVAPWKKWTAVTLSASRGRKYPVEFTVSGLDEKGNRRYSKLITSAAHKYFEIEKPPRKGEGPAAYLVETHPADERNSAVELLRVVYKELIVQFKPDVGWVRRNAILEESKFRTVERSSLAKNQWIVRHVRPETAGESLLKAADVFERFEEVEFAWPNSLAEYRRSSDPIPASHRWWLDRLQVNSQPGARSIEENGAGVVIAVLDDGIDIDHPNLVNRVVPGLGRDYHFSPSEPDFSNPRPKKKEPGVGETSDDFDYHGTLCAGVICSDGSETGFKGVAPGCKLVGVRVFDGADLISERDTVAAAIRYATGVADIILCSWGAPRHKVVAEAIDDTSEGRGGKGSVFVGAAGNDGKLNSIDFPARHPLAIAVGACGRNDEVTDYANRGTRLDVVAPAGVDDTGVYSTDISQPGWGLKTSGGVSGRFSSEFGSTSAAAAMAAGVAALCLEKKPNLTAAQIRSLLRTTAAKVGIDDETLQPVEYNPQGDTGRTQKLGSGRIQADRAVAEA